MNNELLLILTVSLLMLAWLLSGGLVSSAPTQVGDLPTTPTRPAPTPLKTLWVNIYDDRGIVFKRGLNGREYIYPRTPRNLTRVHRTSTLRLGSGGWSVSTAWALAKH